MNTAKDTLAENQASCTPTAPTSTETVSSAKKSRLNEPVAHAMSQTSSSIPQDSDAEDYSHSGESDWDEEEEVRSIDDGKGAMTIEEFAHALRDDLAKDARVRRIQALSETDTEIVISHNEISRLCALHRIELTQFFVQSRNAGLLTFNATQLNFTYRKQ